MNTHFETGGIEFIITPLFANIKLTLKLRLHDKVVGLTELNKTQRIIGLLCAAFKVMSRTF